MKKSHAGLIDCDVHAVVPGIEALVPFLPSYWREQVEQTGFKGPTDRWYPLKGVAADAGIKDAVPASRLEYLKRDVLDAKPTLEFAVLSTDYAVDTLHNPDAASALASAVNDWLESEWLGKDKRLRGSICISPQFPELAAQEIRRRAANRSFVQVLLPARSEAPYGSRNYLPIFRAAADCGLAISLHAGGAPGNASTPVGWPSFYTEEYVGMSSVFQTQLLSIISSGLFDTFREMRMVLAEGGVAWLPSMLWRFDKNWKGLRREIPWVGRPPSEYVREHVRLTTAPFDAPPDAALLRDVLGQLGGVDLLLYASDYPHAHGESAAIADLLFLGAASAARVKCENARTVYGL